VEILVLRCYSRESVDGHTGLVEEQRSTLLESGERVAVEYAGKEAMDFLVLAYS
jgi:hypothetical protein